MYLQQMGEIPLLTREQEIRLAQRIETTRKHFRKRILQNEYVLDKVVEILDEVRSGELPFDRTMRMSDALDLSKDEIIKRLPANVDTVIKVVERDRALFSETAPVEDLARAAAVDPQPHQAGARPGGGAGRGTVDQDAAAAAAYRRAQQHPCEDAGARRTR